MTFGMLKTMLRVLGEQIGRLFAIDLSPLRRSIQWTLKEFVDEEVGSKERVTFHPGGPNSRRLKPGEQWRIKG